MLTLLKILNGPWESVRGTLRTDLDAIQAAFNSVEVRRAYEASIAATVITLVDGATPSLDASLGSVFRLAAAGDRTIRIPTSPAAGQRILIQHRALDANRTLTLNTNPGGFRFGTTTAALTATVANKTDYIECVYNATDAFWDVLFYTKGF